MTLFDRFIHSSSDIRVDDIEGNYTAKTVGGVLAELPSKFQPRASDRLGLSAAEMYIVSGTPTLGNAAGGRVPSWDMADAATSAVGGRLVLPPHWSTFNVIAFWSTQTGTAGNVVLFGDIYNTADGADITASGNVSMGSTTAAAPAQFVLKATTLASGVSAVVGGLAGFRVGRLGSDGADTCASAIRLLGVDFVRAS